MSNDNLMKVYIPYPYPQFTDTEFFLTDSNGLFISDIYYDLSDDRKKVIFKSNASSLGLTKKLILPSIILVSNNNVSCKISICLCTPISNFIY